MRLILFGLAWVALASGCFPYGGTRDVKLKLCGTIVNTDINCQLIVSQGERIEKFNVSSDFTVVTWYRWHENKSSIELNCPLNHTWKISSIKPENPCLCVTGQNCNLKLK
jgi:hypothetical protein